MLNSPKAKTNNELILYNWLTRYLAIEQIVYIYYINRYFYGYLFAKKTKILIGKILLKFLFLF